VASQWFKPGDLIDAKDTAPGGGFSGGLVISGIQPVGVDYGVMFGPPVSTVGADSRFVGVIIALVSGALIWKFT